MPADPPARTRPARAEFSRVAAPDTIPCALKGDQWRGCVPSSPLKVPGTWPPTALMCRLCGTLERRSGRQTHVGGGGVDSPRGGAGQCELWRFRFTVHPIITQC